ncbi:MAG: hypothetical protein V1799_15940 [bacterium]
MDYLAECGNELLFEQMKNGVVNNHGHDLVHAFCQYTHCLMSNSSPEREIEQLFATRLCPTCCIDTTGEFTNLIKMMQLYKV